jgi:sterol 3beta-glucosyltransferase
MRAVVTNFGSTGDVQPYLALAVELHRHGHQPVLVFPPNFASLNDRLGLEYISIGPNLQNIQGDIIAALQTNSDSADQMYSLFTPLVTALPEMFRILSEACQSADILISGPMQPASRMIHELTAIPFISVQENHFGGGGSLAFQQASASLINPFRARYGLPPLRSPLTQDANSPQLALYAMSRHVCQPPPDWPEHHYMTGYFFLDGEQGVPDAGLAQFISSGDPPVTFTFGSMTHDDPKRVTAILLEAIRMADCRAVIQKGWSGLGGLPLPPNAYVTEFAPHAWLFPLSACVVHHGGAGTSAAAFRAGVPAVFVPHNFDQPVWGELAYEMGLTVKPIPIQELSAERLANALKTVLTTPAYEQAAGAIREKIRGEHGVKRARELIEELVEKIGLHRGASAGAETDDNQAEDREEKRNRRKQYQQLRRSRRSESRHEF